MMVRVATTRAIIIMLGVLYKKQIGQFMYIPGAGIPDEVMGCVRGQLCEGYTVPRHLNCEIYARQHSTHPFSDALAPPLQLDISGENLQEENGKRPDGVTRKNTHTMRTGSKENSIISKTTCNRTW